MPELKYLQLFADMLDDHFGILTDEELGIIIRASMSYAFNGELPDFEPRSVLGMTWRRMKSYIDQCDKNASKNKENGNKGGRPKKPIETEQNPVKPKETQQNPTKPNLTQQNHKQEQDQEQDQDHKQEQEQYNAPATDDRVIAFDGSDLTEDIHRYDLADSMIRTYGMVDSDTTRDALIEDLAKYGEAKMREVLKKAAMSNSRAKVSVSFYRTILEDKGGKSRAAPDYQRRQYDDNYFSSIEVNLDAG